MKAARRKELAASGFVGLTLHLSGRFSPETLAERVPWEPVLQGRRGSRLEAFGVRTSRSPLSQDYLKFDLSRRDLESSLRSFFVQVSRMSSRNRAKFTRVRSKTLDIGLATPRGFMNWNWVIPVPSVRRLAALGIEVMVSVYPPRSDK